MTKVRILFVLLLVFTARSGWGFELNEHQQERAVNLYRKFVAPCCWRQSVAEHRSPEATHVRDVIDSGIQEGASDTEIKDRLIREYGHGILMEAEGWRAKLTYTGPVLGLIAGVALFAAWVQRHRPAKQDTETAENALLP